MEEGRTGRKGSWVGLAAFLAPAMAVCVEGVLLATRADAVAADRVVSAFLSGAFVLATLLVGPIRRFFGDLGDFLLSRIPFPVLLLGAIVTGLIATAPGASGLAVGIACGTMVLSVASGRTTARTRPGLFVATFVIFAVNIVVLVALDVVVRMVVLPGKSHNSIFIAHDPWLGWKLRPGFSVDRKTDVYSSREKINSMGFRTPERPFEKPAGVKRVVLLGDSHTEGYTVNDDETYASRLEALLGEKIPVEVLSFGVGGYSTDQELLSYVRYARGFSPDLVVLQCAANDVKYAVLDRYWRGLKPLFRRCGDTLLLEGVPVRDLRRVGLADHPLLQYSAIALVADAFLGRLSVLRREESADMVEAWKVQDLLVRDLASMVRADGALLTMFDATPDSTEADSGFRRIADERGVPFIDITPAFGGDFERHRVPEDLHWNRLGHEAVASFLAPRLLELIRSR